MKKQAKESALVGKIQKHIAAMKAEGYAIKCVKYHGNQYAKAGTPDLHITLNGKSCWVETKRPGEYAGPLQVIELKSWASAGALCAVCETFDRFESIVRHLKAGLQYAVIWADGVIEEFLPC